MAIYNEILAGRYGRMLLRLFSMKGGTPVKQLAGEVIASLPLFNGAENRFLEAWQRYGFQGQQAAVAANFSQIRLRNPVGSNVLAVIEKLNFFCGPNGAAVQDLVRVGFGAFSADYSNVLTSNTRLDARGNQKPVLVSSTQSAGTFTDNLIGAVNVQAGTSADFIVTDIQEITVMPGDAIDLSTTALNEALAAGIIWRERAMEESEIRA